jgi:phosphoglycerol transferase MdoB-like AlkP superfamily enzyme
MAADILYQRFFGDLVSVASIGAVAQISTVAPSVRSLIRVGDLGLWADLAPALVVVWVVSRSATRGSAAVRLSGGLLAAATVLAGIVGGVALSGQAEALRQVFRTTEQARRIGVLNFHAVDVVSPAIRSLAPTRLDADRLAQVERYFAERGPLRSASGPLAGAAAGDNLLMIQVESLQGFVIGLEVGGQEVTPFLNRFVADSLWFTNVTDQTEEGRSSDAELATQVSLLPPNRGAAAFRYDRNHFTGLASILSSRGWDTVSAVPFDGSFWNRRVMHRRFGFDDSLFAEDFPSGETIGWGLNDRDFLTGAAAALVARSEPWCGYLLTLSLHHPFAGFPERHKEIDVGRWRGTPFGNFIHTMRFFDHAFEALVAELDRAGVLDRTVIAVWGDHDAGFEWRPEIAEIMGVGDDSTGWYLSQEVPLIIRVPGLSTEAGPRDVVAGHVDVAPTLLALLGVDPAPYAFVGRNLLGNPGAGPVVGEYRCWRDADHVFLRHGPELTDGQCIDVATLRPVGVGACGPAFEAARRQIEMSEVVLDHDLQQRIHERLLAPP